MSTTITPSPGAMRAAREIGETCVIADGDHDPFVFFESEQCAVIIERELAAAQAKIANQSERIRYLEGATNHATGTPLSQAHAKIAELEQDKARLDQGTILLRGCVYAGQDLRAAIDAARKEGTP
jgi:hypothetical protein